jgi:hypothetical protein
VNGNINLLHTCIYAILSWFMVCMHDLAPASMHDQQSTYPMHARTHLRIRTTPRSCIYAWDGGPSTPSCHCRSPYAKPEPEQVLWCLPEGTPKLEVERGTHADKNAYYVENDQLGKLKIPNINCSWLLHCEAWQANRQHLPQGLHNKLPKFNVMCVMMKKCLQSWTLPVQTLLLGISK